MGSGSACRSLYGGFVKWQKGEKEDGKDSIAIQVAPASHWPEMEMLILVVSAQKKGVSSTVGMKRTVDTCPLMPSRIRLVEDTRMPLMEKAILSRDFNRIYFLFFIFIYFLFIFYFLFIYLIIFYYLFFCLYYFSNRICGSYNAR